MTTFLTVLVIVALYLVVGLILYTLGRIGLAVTKPFTLEEMDSSIGPVKMGIAVAILWPVGVVGNIIIKIKGEA